MNYPALITNKAKLAENIRIIQALCEKNKVSFSAVTKVFCAAPEIVAIYYNAGVRDFADTRIMNLTKINYPDITKWLLRLPMLSEIDYVVKNADISLNSEIETIAALSKAAQNIGKKHKVILMVDVGDLREGVLAENAVYTAAKILELTGVILHGIGVNYNCFGGVIPTAESLSIITGIAEEIEEKFNIKLSIISGGNSGSIHLLAKNIMPISVNNLRLGEVILFGRETSYQELVEGMHEDVFRLEAQIIELKKKPSQPWGEIGLNAFGEKVIFEDKGILLRAILAIGRQDVDMSKITPLDTKITILGQSSDHMIVDLTRSDGYKAGDVLDFSISYGSLLSLSTSPYVNKVYT